MVARAIPPDYALGTHVAPLGLAFSQGARLGPLYASGAFVGLHGSWNRRPLAGYKVVFVPFADGRPTGQPIDVLTGFLDARGHAQGRPVGVAIGRDGVPARRRRRRQQRLAGQHQLGIVRRGRYQPGMDFDHIRLEQNPAGVATITLNRPDSLNALNCSDDRRDAGGAGVPARLRRARCCS